ncbi:hypothetical protein JX266_000019 [Neoarthrinium moseri]|nr:hypothetical protein JX266_000019 [Neoarthrinium moseri]
MKGHVHSHAHRHLHGSGYRLSPRIPSRQSENVIHLGERATAVEGSSLTGTVSSSLFRRSDCKAGDNSAQCEKPAGGTSLTIPITLAVVIPIVIAFCVLVYLHRRTSKRHKQEDEDAKYKSMDFGLGDAPTGKGKRKSKLFGGEKEASHTKGLSMDMNLSSPYLLPPHIQQSRESLNSLARTLHQNEDPYRHVDSFVGSDAASMRSFPRGADKRASIYTQQTNMSGGRSTPRIQSLHNLPPRQNSLPTAPLPPIPAAAKEAPRHEVKEVVPPQSAPPMKSEFRFTDDETPLPQVGGEHVAMPAMPEVQEPAPVAQREAPQSVRPTSYESIKADQSYVGGLVGDRDSSALPAADLYHNSANGLGIMDVNPPQASVVDNAPVSLRPGQKEANVRVSDVPSEYEDYANGGHAGQMEPYAAAMEQEHPHSAGLGVPQQDNKRLSVGFRPLPPDDYLESEDPEFRANRIRSFYKEYFDDGSKEPRPPMPQPQSAQYYEDYDPGYLGETAYFDPDSNAFVMPYAQPVTRRAMTPPPNNRRPMPGPGPRQRGPPGPRGMGPPGPRPRAGSTMSGGRFGPASPRPGSSASARMGGRPGPKKPMAPLAALPTLPTPSKLRDDSFAIINAADFAPPPSFKDQARGRSQSPLGERLPYAVNVPAVSPLVSSFDDMSSLPSPHLLRKSSTFTGLDFAPPRRFKDPDSMSDAGSVRSMGSGISAMNNNALRAGAGRISRLPGDQVFTAASTENQLKPKWGMRD